MPTANETVISQIGRAVFGTGVAYYVLQLSTMGILVLAANTSFADFPRLASLLARDGYMPSRFAFRGERLAFSAGIVALAVLSIVVVVAFGGRVEALIPLYAIGVFTSITLSQAGMVVHWWRGHGRGLAAKPRHQRRRRRLDGHRHGHLRGREVRARRVAGRGHHPDPGRARCCSSARQYRRRRVETEVGAATVIGPPHRHQRVIVPASDVTRDVVQAIRFGRTMSDDVSAVHVTDDVAAGARIRDRFERQLPGVPLVIVESPYRSLVRPLVRYLEDAAAALERRCRHRAAPRVRAAALVGAAALQRERPPDRAVAARPPERPRRRRSRTARER